MGIWELLSLAAGGAAQAIQQHIIVKDIQRRAGSFLHAIDFASQFAGLDDVMIVVGQSVGKRSGQYSP